MTLKRRALVDQPTWYSGYTYGRLMADRQFRGWVSPGYLAALVLLAFAFGFLLGWMVK